MLSSEHSWILYPSFIVSLNRIIHHALCCSPPLFLNLHRLCSLTGLQFILLRTPTASGADRQVLCQSFPSEPLSVSLESFDKNSDSSCSFGLISRLLFLWQPFNVEVPEFCPWLPFNSSRVILPIPRVPSFHL